MEKMETAIMGSYWVWGLGCRDNGKMETIIMGLYRV